MIRTVFFFQDNLKTVLPTCFCEVLHDSNAAFHAKTDVMNKFVYSPLVFFLGGGGGG